ncbi:MAG: family 10 glycosylhydrolase [Paludibacteraceae bacterium]|nr:family 10 glycosylhydrolase [Paludibacteraceae bacterium]
MKKTLLAILFSLSLSLSLSTITAQIPFRGAWIATVANIDWPSANAVGNDSLQQAEMTFILDSLQSLGINAIIFQVRPTADALYESELEPWSHWLTGKQGRKAGYDPLEWMVQECHSRGMELHAWLNPYRINIASMKVDSLSYNHPFYQHPEWFWNYGKQWYFNPALPDTREWICMVVYDVVCRYNIDAIHMDDYFYPYPIAKCELPDAADFARDPRGFTDIRDWRRDNVNLTIQAISQTIRDANPNVQFGISPFGVYKEGSGLTNYYDLYADILLWIQNGWIDYVVPQLYWNIGNKRADYEQLAHWWANAVDSLSTLNTQHSTKLYIGMAPYRLGGTKEISAWREGNEIARQMRLNRTIPGIDGECFYSTRPLLANPLHVCDSIKAIYNEN